MARSKLQRRSAAKTARLAALGDAGDHEYVTATLSIFDKTILAPGVQINTALEAEYSDVTSRVELAKFIDNQVPYNEADMNHFLTPNMEAGKKELMRAWQFGFDVSMKGNPGNTELTKQRNLVERMLVFGFESDPDDERLIVVTQRAFYKEDEE